MFAGNWKHIMSDQWILRVVQEILVLTNCTSFDNINLLVRPEG